MTKWVGFFALVFTALALVPGGAHLFSLLNKIDMPQEHYFVAQSIYRGWWLMALILIPAMLLDLSVDGAQVLTATTLRPHQHVRVALPDGPRPIRLRASVRWAKLEMPKEGPRFRAGLQFADADLPSLGRFIDAHRAV